jgi:hypothetical protein
MERAATTSLVVRLNQLQDDEPFLDPVPIEFTVNGKPERRTIYPKGKLTTETINYRQSHSAKIDPDETLLKEVVRASLKRSNRFWSAVTCHRFLKAATSRSTPNDSYGFEDRA